MKPNLQIKISKHRAKYALKQANQAQAAAFDDGPSIVQQVCVNYYMAML